MKKLLLLCLLCAASPVWSAPHSAPQADAEPDYTRLPVKWPTIGPKDKWAVHGFNTRVAALQYLLRGRGHYRGKIDGIYGAKTVAAVKAFQKSKKLRADGIAGPKTLPLLVVTIKRGSKGDAVRAAQILARGASDHVAAMPNLGLAVDGVFGKSTENAVATAQYSVGGMEGLYAKADGIMGPRSWCLMLGGDVVGGD